jgi:hypothetical protein
VLLSFLVVVRTLCYVQYVRVVSTLTLTKALSPLCLLLGYDPLVAKYWDMEGRLRVLLNSVMNILLDKIHPCHDKCLYYSSYTSVNRVLSFEGIIGSKTAMLLWSTVPK